MIRRCTKTAHHNFEGYGGRGITVCERWRDFVAFLEDMGERPDGLTLDRIDNNAGYSPENCRWATPKQQARNKRDKRLLTLNGETRSVTEWAEKLGVERDNLWSRLHIGWTVEEALTRPIKARARKAV